MTLGQIFDPRQNALNAWRLALATTVILWHSWPLTGHRLPFPSYEGLLAQVGVDGFFALSGFLIMASWMRHPSPRDFFIARALRIFPGLWICLAITAFVIAPVSVAIQGGSAASLMGSSEPYEYFLNNAVLNVFYAGIDGTPRDIPWPGIWNGSIWTLIFEFVCYIAVAALGVTGVLKQQWVIPTAFVLFLCAAAYLSYPVFAMETIPQMVARFALMFAAGALLYQYRDALPARWSLVAICLGVLALSGLTSNYRVMGALPLAYVVIVSGALIHDKRLNLRNDLSYGVYIYAFPIQQLLAVAGLAVLPPFLFFLVATALTLPLAALSWFVVEKHAMALKARFRRAPVP